MNKQELDYDAAKVSVAVITHAHLDHVGRLPILVKQGFRGRIMATAATLELTSLVLKDAFDIMASKAEESGEPLMYEQADLQRTLDLFSPIPYRKATKLEGADTVTLYDAGHILGSATVELTVDGKELIFSGDIGHAPSTLLPHAETPKTADLVVTEATYGGVNRQVQQDKITVLKDALKWTVEHRGVLLIPAFAVERSQELIYLFNHLFNAHQLPKIPIYFDSPLAIEALEVFERHQELFAKDVQKERAMDSELFDFRGLILTPTSDDSRDINDAPQPKVIISGSGMMEGGRIAHHLKRYIARPETLLLVIGYQAAGTLGSRIVDGARSVDIHGEQIPVRAKIEIVDAFSGHADNKELLAWLQGMKINENGQVAIVHSEPDRAEAYQKELEQLLPGRKIVVAEPGLALEI